MTGSCKGPISGFSVYLVSTPDAQILSLLESEENCVVINTDPVKHVHLCHICVGDSVAEWLERRFEIRRSAEST